MKKLIPALCMLLVAAALLGTSTFAWFSMNTSVTATGMSVKATTPKSLLISTDKDSGFGNTATLSSDVTVGSEIYPSHYNKKMVFAKLNAEGMKLVDQSGADTGAAATEMTAFINGTETEITGKAYIEAAATDYYKDEVYLKYEGESGTAEITLAVAFATAGTDNIKNAMHVVVVKADGTVALDYDTTAAGVAKDLGITLTANEAATKLTVYYFLDGEDADCKNSNITQSNTLGVTLTFAVKS